MASVNIYLTFNGNCKEAFEFYRSVFGGEFVTMSTFGDMPPGDESSTVPPEEASRVMHVSLPVSAETWLMGSDTAGEWSSQFREGNNYSISINAESKEEADRLFSGLSADGRVTMPMEKTFWGAYFGMFTDKFGIQWMVNYDECPNE